jgi:hypothetical protein
VRHEKTPSLFPITHSFRYSSNLEEISSAFSQAIIAAADPAHPHNNRLFDIIESLVHLEGHFTFDQQTTENWSSAICEEDVESHRNLLFACLRIGYRRFYTIPTQRTAISRRHIRMIPLVFSSEDEGVIGDFLCAWCTNPVSEGTDYLARYAGNLVDLANLESFGWRLQYLVFRALGRMKHTDFEQVGLSKLIALLDRIEGEAMFRAPELRDFLLNALSSPEGRKVFPLRYWWAAAELAARDRDFHSPDLPRMDLIRSLEAESEWEKLTWWIGVIWASCLPVGVVEGQMEDIVGSTELVVRHNSGAATTIRHLVNISSKLALGVQHAEALRSILEMRQDGHVDNFQEGSSGIQ